jgi:hypothetical protein
MMMNRKDRRVYVVAVALGLLAATACGASATAGTGAIGPAASPTTTSALTATTDAPTTTAPTTTPASPEKFVCPVTIPPEPGLSPPPPYSPDHPDKGLVWFGTDELWTALALDGRHGPRKNVFWSVNFPGGGEEERPDLDVAWTRLDGDTRIVDVHGDATNAYTVEEHWFMMAGIDPNDPGCWQVEASYKGATLSYVYELE